MGQAQVLLNLRKNGCILSKESFGASHSLRHGSLYSREGLGGRRKITDISHDGKKILGGHVNRFHWK